MGAILVLALLASSPAAAQVGPTPSSAAQMAFAREQQAAGELNASGASRFGQLGDPRVDDATLRRAGAWGRCVTAAAPDLSRAYLDAQVSAMVLRPMFRDCLRQTGKFTGSGWGEVRRAAISDALRV